MPDLTFHMQVYREPDQGRQTVVELRRHFPSARIVVYCDGGADGRAIFRDLEVDYIHSRERTFTRGCLSVHLMLERFLERPTAHLFKIDADTEIHRPLRRPPPSGCVLGTLQFAELPDESVQGGCMGFSADAAGTIYRSRLLLDERLAGEDDDTDDPWLIHLTYRRRTLGLGSFDWSIAWACAQLGIPMREFDDVRALWQRRPEFRPGEFAITHPRADRRELLDDPDAGSIRAGLASEIRVQRRAGGPSLAESPRRDSGVVAPTPPGEAIR